MHLAASICPSVCVSIPVQGVCLCVCNQWAYTDNSTDAVDQLLILYRRQFHYVPNQLLYYILKSNHFLTGTAQQGTFRHSIAMFNTTTTKITEPFFAIR